MVPSPDLSTSVTCATAGAVILKQQKLLSKDGGEGQCPCLACVQRQALAIAFCPDALVKPGGPCHLALQTAQRG